MTTREARHTPGPWELEGPVQFTFHIKKGDVPIASVYTGRFGPAASPDAEGEANARLIAAAPDLLAALPDPTKLDLLADWLDLDDVRRNRAGYDDVQTDLRCWAKLARAAIEGARAP